MYGNQETPNLGRVTSIRLVILCTKYYYLQPSALYGQGF